MLETIILAGILALPMLTARKAMPTLRGLWTDATWLEKLGLCLLLAPIPGPVDEIIGALVISRIIHRRNHK